MGPLKVYRPIPNPLPRVRWPGGELLAIRVWRLVRWTRDGGLRLQSLSGQHVWHGPVFRSDVRPEPECAHGVYAIKFSSRPRLSREFDWISGRDSWIWGWVALSGRVIEHEQGYRAERAVVRRLHLGVQTHLRFPEYVDALGAAWELECRYECPVKLGYYERRKAARVRYFLQSSRSSLLPIPETSEPPPRGPRPVSLTAGLWNPPGLVLPPPPLPPERKRLISVLRIVRAFQRAERELGKTWQLKGRGHVRRVSVPHRIRAKVCDATNCWVEMYPSGSMRRQVLFPLAIVRRAARILRVASWDLYLREWTWGSSGEV